MAASCGRAKQRGGKGHSAMELDRALLELYVAAVPRIVALRPRHLQRGQAGTAGPSTVAAPSSVSYPRRRTEPGSRRLDSNMAWIEIYHIGEPPADCRQSRRNDKYIDSMESVDVMSGELEGNCQKWSRRASSRRGG